MIYILWALVILFEVLRNHYIIEHLKQNPNHSAAFRGRIIVGFLFWMTSPLIHKMRVDQWWAMPFMLVFTFFFFFDLGLNIFRKLPYFYLGDGAQLDRLQKKYGGAFVWFWWKLFLMIGSIAFYVYGWRVF